jgi:bidirectional [NiFe] hydrogenase diaphorase subunit
MPVPPQQLPAPSDDKRWRLVDAAMRRYNYRANALIETLHIIQETFGYLDKPGLEYVSRSLRVPYSRAYGVATFYNHFTMKPPGEHTCIVCLGTACYIKGAGDLMMELERTLGVKAGETTPDGKVSLLAVRCIGSCGLAPAGVVDGQVMPKATSAQMLHQLKEGKL